MDNKLLPATRSKFDASRTQKQSLTELTESGQRTSQKNKVLSIIIDKGPVCIRKIALDAGIEVSAVCRCIKDLEQNIPPLIKIAFEKPSEFTGRKVQYYSDVNWKPDTDKQLKLVI